MSKCANCPVKDGLCRAESDPRYQHFCRLAESGGKAQLLAITIASGIAPPPPPPAPPKPLPRPVSPTKGVGGCCGGEYRQAQEWWRGLSAEDREATRLKPTSSKLDLVRAWRTAKKPG